LKDKPFALIGVNVGGNARNLKDVVKKENLTWRSFADQGTAGQGPIAARWNLTNTPTLYVLDPRGVIRYKWVGGPGEKAIDAALDKLMKEKPQQDRVKTDSRPAVDPGTGPKPSDQKSPGPRSFRLGFTPDDLLDTPEVSETVYKALSKHADLVAFHIGLGVPWEAALTERPFPPAVERHLAKLSRLKGRLRGDQAVYLALTPLNLSRNDIAAHWGGDAAGAKNWKGRALDDPETIRAYTSFCRRMIRTFKPDYFAYGVEVNMLAEVSSRKFKQFRVLAKQVYETLKAENPNLPIFLTFQIDVYHKHRAQQCPIITELLPYSDFIAVSTYPYMEGHSPQTLPEDWFADLAAIDRGKPFAIAETGFIAEESYRNWLTGKSAEGSEGAQAAYVRQLLRCADCQQARFVVWFFPQDLDEFWNGQTNPLVRWFVKIWRDSGLVDGSGREREGLKEWDRWLQQPKAPARR
jgi:hypothetical protein